MATPAAMAGLYHIRFYGIMKAIFDIGGYIMSIMVREKSFYKRLGILALPIVLQNAISFAVNFADNVMVAQLGDLAVSGVGAGNQVQNFLQMAVMGLGTVIVILGSQYWASQDIGSIKTIVSIALKASVAIGIIFLCLGLFLPGSILGLITDKPDIVDAGVQYLRIVALSYVFFCMTQTLSAGLRCVESVNIGMYLSILALVVNVGLNWVLIFGKLGFPALGVVGAAIATTIARVVEFLFLVGYIILRDRKLRFGLKDIFRHDKNLFKDFIRYGVPVLMGDVLWGLNMFVQSAILGRMVAEAFAASNVVTPIFSFFSIVVYGTANASGIIIGKTVGEGDFVRLKQYTKTLQVIFLMIGIVSGLMLFVCRAPVLTLYTGMTPGQGISEEARRYAMQFLAVLSVTLVGTAYQMSVLTGIVRAGGSTHFVLINDLIWVWIVVIPSALIASYVFNAPPWVVFLCLKSDQILKCIVAVIKVNRFNWYKQLTRPAEAK